ncbi:hypothetical protein OF83DRAFT_1164870 [Amylostereum chailletii]|nr:hypothetical protein OF83DRAFT_1164870 [Amylostereum chailletii]
MSRSLRDPSRRPNYIQLAQIDDEEDLAAGHSQLEGTPGSDFAQPSQGAAEAMSVDDVVPDSVGANDDAEPSLKTRSGAKAKVKGKGKGKARADDDGPQAEQDDPETPPTNASFIPDRPSNRQMYALPQPSVNHRHKAIPIFRQRASAERLVRPPVLFEPNETVSTNSYTSDTVVTHRLNQAWGHNVGPGPLWELLEDRGWFKEAGEAKEDGAGEATRRPTVYQDLSMPGGWSVIDFQDAIPFLPHASDLQDGILSAPPPVTCAFGPFAKQTPVEMNVFESLKMSQFFDDNKSHVFNAGGPIWGLDWCPIHIHDRPGWLFSTFLPIDAADVAPFPTIAHSPDIGVKASSSACIQIWSLGPSPVKDPAEDEGILRCEMVICIDNGPAFELKWCPLPSHDPLAGPSPGAPRKLGLLAGTFEDGTVSILAVPYPPDLVDPALRLIEPLVRIELDETSCWTIDWANSERIVVGCTNGAIAVYDLGAAIRGQTPARNLLPSQYLFLHQSAVRAVSWLRAPPSTSTGEPCLTEDPTVIASGGYDGMECLTDIRDPSGNTMNRTRDTIPCIPFSPYAGGPIAIDHENIVKAYSASPSMLGRGHTLMEPNGPVWCAHTSDYHAQLAVGSADGSCHTTNMLRSARRGGTVPFFQHKIFQLDYSRATQTYRMLEHFLPRETPDRSNASQRTKKGKPGPAGVSVGTGAWTKEVAVVRVAWHAGSGLAGASLLASGTAVGLGRVDWLEGRWLRGRVPYTGVETIRKEEGGKMDVDGEDEDDDESS